MVINVLIVYEGRRFKRKIELWGAWGLRTPQQLLTIAKQVVAEALEAPLTLQLLMPDDSHFELAGFFQGFFVADGAG
jgi:hypothetical protein